LALEIADALGAEIVSMDSMALYRGMDIGTAKPTAAERARVPHHAIDVLDPWESSSVAWWLDLATCCCQEIESRGKRVLFVGGTPLYLKALFYGLFDGPPADLDLRRALEDEAAQAGADALHRRLAQVDIATASRLHPNDIRRIVRALEVFQLTGVPLSQWQKQWPAKSDALAPPIQGTPQVLWLDLPRPELYARIDVRVREMFAAGFVEEVRSILALPRPLSREANQALGYAEVAELLKGQMTLEQAISTVQTRTRQFAKRQITWFRHLFGCHPASKELTRELWKPTI
jgi:tRNA dimethylallyltransferase